MVTLVEEGKTAFCGVTHVTLGALPRWWSKGWSIRKHLLGLELLFDL